MSRKAERFAKRYNRGDNIDFPLDIGELVRYDPHMQEYLKDQLNHIHDDNMVRVQGIRSTDHHEVGSYLVRAPDGCMFWAAPWELVR